MLTPIINLVAALTIAVSTIFGGMLIPDGPAISQVSVVSGVAVPTEQPPAAVPSTSTYQRIAELLTNTNANSQSSEYSVIERGNAGEAVLRLQQRLQELGYYTGTPSGKMDSATQLAFKKFEKANGFAANGIASPEEQTVLFSEAAVKAE